MDRQAVAVGEHALDSQRVHRHAQRPHPARKRHLGESLEIPNASIPPPLGIVFLYVKLPSDLREYGRADIFLKSFPCLLIRLHRRDAPVVVQAEFIPKSLSAGHRVIPRDMMEPQQELLRACLQRIEHGRQGLVVLVNIVRPGACPVEAHAVRPGLMIVDAGPVRADALLPRPWTVM